MYYDRSIDETLADAVGPGGALSWLMDHVRSSEGRMRHAHLQFRRDRGDRRHGSVQLYWGRTSPLEFRLRRGGRVRLTADRVYRELSKGSFSKAIPVEGLGALESELRAYLRDVAGLLANGPPRRRAFVTREAACHAGLMRRYGHGWRTGDPLVVIDSEAQIGYSSRARRAADDAAIRGRLQLRDSEPVPRKLDALGVLPTGDLAVVEVKDTRGNIVRALIQAAVHAVRFSGLLGGGVLRRSAQAMIEQKAATGVIPPGCPRLHKTPRIVPCIAAPATSTDWPASWREAVDDSSAELAAAVPKLLFMRLNPDGRILEVEPR